MSLKARLKSGETLADRIIKVDHAGEHGAICIYTAQRWIARWRAPDMVAELGHFLDHERKHRDVFVAQLEMRAKPRCRSYHLCGIGGSLLGLATGMLGRKAIAATTIAIERVVLQHLHGQVAAIEADDAQAADALKSIIEDEQEHHDVSQTHLENTSVLTRMVDTTVSMSTEAVIWLGMRL